MPLPTTSTEPRPVLFGMFFDALTLAQALDRVFEFAATPPGERGCRIVATVNVDFLVHTYFAWRSRPRDPELVAVLRRAELVVADGMPLVWLSRLLKTPLPERVSGSDLTPLIAERAACEHRKLYFLGGIEEYTRRAAERLCACYPGLEIEYATPFVRLDDPDAAERDRAICQKINASGASILLVGFGNPKQELWVERNRKNLNCPIAIGVGGTFNFLAGAVKRAPEWMRRGGLEWIYRFIQEPRRLWRRYCVGFFQFGVMALGALSHRPRKGGAEVTFDEGSRVLSVVGRGCFSPDALGTILRAAAERPVRIAGLRRCQRRQLRVHRLADLVEER